MDFRVRESWLCEADGVNDTEFFQKALGLSEPWQVTSVQLNLADRRVVVGVHYAGQGFYDQAGQRMPIHGY